MTSAEYGDGSLIPGVLTTESGMSSNTYSTLEACFANGPDLSQLFLARYSWLFDTGSLT